MDRNSKLVKVIVTVLASALSLFVLYYALFGNIIVMKQRAIVLLFSLVICFLTYPIVRRQSEKVSIADIIFMILSVVVTMYTVINFEAFISRVGMPTTMDLVMGSIAILLILEAGRRTIGWVLPSIAALFILYAFWGNYLPGIFNHQGYPIQRVINHLYITSEGIYGVALGVAATFVFLFILFGSFLEKSGASQYFMDVAISLTGKSKGGPAKIAIIASGMMGSISGSSIANVVGTGTFTIPLIKRVGYKPNYAAAVEASASTGGQILPPVMGAAAFIMAEFIGVPYFSIIIAAAIPAVLYYFSLYMSVHFEAMKLDIGGLPESEIPKFNAVFWKGILYFVPLVVITVVLFRGSSPMKAAFIGIVSVLIISILRKSSRFNLKNLIDAFTESAKSIVSIVAATACAGIIIGIVSLTGVGLKFTTFVLSFSQGYLLIALILTMIASIILGMSLPTVATYIVLSVLTAPALGDLGIPLMTAHLFILYFGVFADITPPVALASYAAAGIAKCPPMSAALKTFQVAFIGFLIPFIFVYNQGLLLEGSITDIALAVITTVIAIVALAASLQRYFLIATKRIEEIALIISSLGLVFSNIYFNAIGFIIFIVIFFIQYKNLKKTKKGVAVYV